MNLKQKLEKYLKENLKEIKRFSTSRKMNIVGAAREAAFQEDACTLTSDEINQFIENNKEDDTFQTKLFSYIDSKNLKDSDVYNKVDIDRRLFSKIRSNRDYHPSKETVILLGIALELTEEEIENLLESASYSLPKNTTFDLIVRFCFMEKIYDLKQINEFLYDHNCKTLTGE